MAKQLSIKEKLEAARRGGPATPAGETAATPAPAPEPSAEASPVAAKAVPANVPSPSSLGRPLTLKEKLAAAKSGGARQLPEQRPSLQRRPLTPRMA